MDIKKLKVGKRVNYTSRAHIGVAVIRDIYTKPCGRHGAPSTWVKLYDKARDAEVTVRAGQLT